MESVGFTVGLAQHFARPTKLNGEDSLRNWLDMFSPSLFEQMDEQLKHAIMEKTINNLKETLYKNGEWYADYKRIRIFALKK